MQIQLECGFCLTPIYKEIAEKYPFTKNLLNKLSYFKIITNEKLEITNADPVVATYYNLISRGLPTWPSTFIEDLFATTFVKTVKTSTNNNEFTYKFINDEYFPEILRALHIIDPRQKTEDFVHPQILQNPLYENLINNFILINIGKHFLYQFTYNRPFQNLVEISPLRRKLSKTELFSDDQIIPFSCEIPYTNYHYGLIIEPITPEQKNNINYFEIEELNEKLTKIGWANKILIYDLFLNKNELKQIEEFSYNNYFDYLRQNEQKPLYKNEAGLIALQLTLSPFAIARIQKTILYSILTNKLDLNAQQWNIAIIERDVPAAFIAIEDLKNHFENFFLLENKNRKLPKINLTVYNTPEFENCDLSLLSQTQILSITDFNPNDHNYDLVIDISVLAYEDFQNPYLQTTKNYIRILSSNYHQLKRKFIPSHKINYKLPNFALNINIPQDEKKQNEQLYTAINFFIKNIFHFKKLTFLQTKFLKKIFDSKNVLAAVPENTQISYIYFFATLLQPTVSLNINYLMANIKHNIDLLFDKMIDAVAYYSPLTQNIYDKLLAITKLETFQTLLFFLTPDRLHIQEFRNSLKNISTFYKYFYIVVNHAHCVSEISFDFNPFYPSITKNIQNNLGHNHQFICTTSTSSYDTNEDICYFFKIKKENVIFIEHTLNNIDLNIIEIQNTSETNEETLLELKAQKVLELKEGKTIFFNSTPCYFKEYFNQKGINCIEYTGTIDYKSHFISTRKSQQSYQNYKEFTKTNNYEILSSSYSLALSCQLKADTIIFSEIPFSIELFIEALNKAYNNNKVKVYILKTNNEQEQKIFSEILTEDFEIVEFDEIIKLSTDFKNRRKEQKRFSTNIVKEYKIIQELWSEIYHPTETLADILSRRIYLTFDKNVKLFIPHSPNPTKLIIYDNDDNPLGYIDFIDNILVNQTTGVESEITQQILDFLFYDIQKIVPNPFEILKVLYDPIKIANQYNNLYSILSKKNNQEYSLIVEFYNSEANKFIEKYGNQIKPQISYNQLIYLYEKSEDLTDFLENFRKQYEFENLSENEQYHLLKKLYLNFRTFYDTLSAIYRLYSINIIKDFVIDFQNQYFIIYVKAINETDVIDTIYKKINIHLPYNFVYELFEKINKTKGFSLFEKAINFFVQFNYYLQLSHNEKELDFIEKKFLDFSNNPNQLLPLLNNYFQAKYISELSKFIDSTNLNFIYDYFDTKYMFLNELKHLNRSSELLLNQNQDNPFLTIIHGLSGLLISKNEESQLYKYLDILTTGLTNYRTEKNTVNIESEINNILILIEKLDMEIKNIIEKIFYLQLHTKWLKYFNKKIKFLFSNKF